MMTRLASLAALAIAALLLNGCFGLAATGIGAAALMADDRRTAGMYLEDENIEWKAIAKIAGSFGGSHVNATSFNRKVLLTGEASTEDTKKAIEDAIRSIPNVRDVTNEIVIAGNSSITSRGNDSIITSNVKARMVANGKFSPNHVKVVTEAGAVFLMGIVTPDEGEAAVAIARSTSGVSRVVKVFELVSEASLRR